MRIGVPNRGRMYDVVYMLFANKLVLSESWNARKMIHKINEYDNQEDIEIVLVRSTDIPKLIEDNTIQMGITGNDYYLESWSNITEIVNLNLLCGNLCILTQKNSDLNTINDLFDKKRIVCYSQYSNLATLYLSKLINDFKCNKIDGAAETYLLLKKCDIIIDVVSSGQTYLANDLKVIHNIIPVSSHLYANNDFINDKFQVFKYCCENLFGYKVAKDFSKREDSRIKLNIDIQNLIGRSI